MAKVVNHISLVADYLPDTLHLLQQFSVNRGKIQYFFGMCNVKKSIEQKLITTYDVE